MPVEPHRGGGRVEGGNRVERNRRRRSQAFLTAGLRIVTEEGLEALTMARLADDLDTAVGSVYRYYGSKSDLIAAIQGQAIEQLRRSHDASVTPMVAAVAPTLVESEALVRLVVLGRWMAAAAQRYEQEVRLLQMVSSRRASTLSRAGAADLMGPTMALVMAVSGTIEAAITAGDLDEGGDPLERSIVWLTAFGGVFVAEDLERYLPDVFGGGRLVRRLAADLFVGWGAPRAAIDRIDAAVDALGRVALLDDGGQGQ